MSEVQVKALSDICDPNRGITYGIVKVGDFVTGGVPVIRGGDIRDGIIVFDDHKRVTEKVSQQHKRTILKGGEIVINLISDPGHTAIVPADMSGFNVSRDVAVIPLDDSVNHRYVDYYLKSPQCINYLIARLQGSVTQKINLSTLKELPIPIPSLEVQQKIVDYLYSIDQKIILNRSLNQTLEKIAQALFKSWFVDFDPVKAKIAALEAGGSAEDAELAAMGVIAAKTPEELAELKQTKPETYQNLARTAALFPSAMQESELGEIPEGWDVYVLSELVSLTGGGTPKRSESEFWGGDISWFSVRDVPEPGNVFVIDTEEKITDLGFKKSSTKLLPQGTTIITARGTVGKLALLAKPMCMNQSCYGVNGKSFGPFFNYYYLSQAVSTLKQNTHGAVFDTITTSTFDTYRSSYCGDELAQVFEEYITPLMNLIVGNLNNNKVLTEMRDHLLPRLLSGELGLCGEATA